VIIFLLGSDLIYFELNPNGQLLEVERKDNLNDVTCLALAQVPEGRQRCPFAVAGCLDRTVRVLSLESSDCLKVKATQTVAASPVSVMLLEASISAAGAKARHCCTHSWCRGIVL
jgi:splicing factor 3B subunit 3